MSCFVVDVRANQRFGGYQYGVSLAKELLPLIVRSGNRAYVLCERAHPAEMNSRLGNILTSRAVGLTARIGVQSR
jgi:hypothetical protein